MYQLEFDTSVNGVCPLIKGQALYYVSISGIKKLLLERSFEVGDIKRYSAKYDSYIGGHKTFSEKDINENIFTSHSEANKKYDKMKNAWEYIEPSKMKISMAHTFIAYTPGLTHGNGNLLILDANIAIINDNMLYVQRYADYAYLKMYETRENLESEYRYYLKEMKNYQYDGNVITELYTVKPTIKTMFKIDSSKYAEADFIERREVNKCENI